MKPRIHNGQVWANRGAFTRVLKEEMDYAHDALERCTCLGATHWGTFCPVHHQSLPEPDRLAKQRDITKQDLLAKFYREDWHGVADAANDLREIEAELRVLNREAPLTVQFKSPEQALRDSGLMEKGPAKVGTIVDGYVVGSYGPVTRPRKLYYCKDCQTVVGSTRIDSVITCPRCHGTNF